jgi:hypothetical protein
MKVHRGENRNLIASLAAQCSLVATGDPPRIPLGNVHPLDYPTVLAVGRMEARSERTGGA